MVTCVLSIYNFVYKFMIHIEKSNEPWNPLSSKLRGYTMATSAVEPGEQQVGGGPE